MKYRKSLLFLGLSFAILIVMIYFVGIDSVIASLKVSNKWLILFAVLVEFFIIFLYTLRWELINNVIGFKTKLNLLFLLTLVGLTLNNITPSGRGGGEPVRAYLLSNKKKIPIENTFATVVADRTLDVFPFVVLAVIAIIGVILYFSLDPIILITMILAVLLIITLLLVIVFMSVNREFGEKISGWIIKLLRRFYKKNSEELENKVTSIVGRFQENMNIVVSDRKIIMYGIPLSFLIWFFEIFRVFVVFFAFGTHLSPIIIAEIFIITSLIGMVPLIPGGLGVVDAVMIIFYSAAGVSPSIAAGATVIERLISFWLPTILGTVILLYYGFSILDNTDFSSLKKDGSIKESEDDSCNIIIK